MTRPTRRTPGRTTPRRSRPHGVEGLRIHDIQGAAPRLAPPRHDRRRACRLRPEQTRRRDRDELAVAVLQRREPRRGRSAGALRPRRRSRSSTTCARPTSSASRRSRTTTARRPLAPTQANVTLRAPDRGDRGRRRPDATTTARSTRSPDTRRRRARRQHPRRRSCSAPTSATCASSTGRAGPPRRRPTPAARRRGGARLTLSPGRVDPTNPVFDNSRKPLAGEFRYRGRPLFVVGNHFNSKGGDDPLFGRFQEPRRSSELQRRGSATAPDEVRGQAGVLNAFVRGILDIDPRAQRGRARRLQRLRLLGDAAGARAGPEHAQRSGAREPVAPAPAARALLLHLPGQRPGPGPHPRQPGAAAPRPAGLRARPHQRGVLRPGLRPRPADRALRRLGSTRGSSSSASTPRWSEPGIATLRAEITRTRRSASTWSIVTSAGTTLPAGQVGRSPVPACSAASR